MKARRHAGVGWVVLAVALLAFGLAAALAARVPEVPEDVGRYVWDLTLYYKDDAAWEADRRFVESGITSIPLRAGTLAGSPKNLADALDEAVVLKVKAAKLRMYGYLATGVDSNDEAAQDKSDTASALESRVDGASAFLGPEIAAIGEPRLAQWRREEPRLSRHAIRIREALREAAHQPPPGAREVVAALGRWPETSQLTYWALMESNLPWPRLGETVLDRSAFLRLRGSLDPRESREANATFLARLKDLEAALGILLARRIEADLTIAKARGFSSGSGASLASDGIPEGRHTVIFDVAREAAPTVRRYLTLRAKTMGSARPTYGDLYPRLPGDTNGRSVAEATEIALAAVAPLGADYQARMRERLGKPWMHLPETPGKRPMYGIFPPVGGVPPFTIMTYRGNDASLRSFTAAAVLMMTFADIPPEIARDLTTDPPIYGNAVIYAANILHDDLRIARAKDPAERLRLIVTELDLLWRMYFRYAHTADLEGAIEERVKRNASPGGAEISRLYLDILRRTYGHPDSIDVPDHFAQEWMVFDQMFSNYAQQNWPPALAAGCLLAEKIQAGDPAAKRVLTSAMNRSEQNTSYDLFAQSGIDLVAPETYRAVARRMERLIAEAGR